MRAAPSPSLSESAWSRVYGHSLSGSLALTSSSKANRTQKQVPLKTSLRWRPNT